VNRVYLDMGMAFKNKYGTFKIYGIDANKDGWYAKVQEVYDEGRNKANGHTVEPEGKGRRRK